MPPAEPSILAEPPQAPSPVIAEAVDIDCVAELLSISRSSAKTLAAEGHLPEPALSVGKIRRWWRSEISAWLMSGCPPRARWVGMKDAAIRRYLNAKGAA
jgi:predicted DNA-binding transcriptional regulator AlpA